LQVTRLKNQASDWLKSGNATVQHLSERMLFLSFFILTVSAEALVRWDEKIKYLVTVYFFVPFVPKIIKIDSCMSELE